MGQLALVCALHMVHLNIDIDWFIDIYMSVCKTVHTLRKSYHVGPLCIVLRLLFGAPLWGVAFSMGKADGAISAEDSPDTTATKAVRVQLPDTRSARTTTATRPYAYRYRTQEAQLKPDCCTEGRRIGSRTTSAYSFLYYFFILYMYLSINIISLLSVYSHLSHLPSLLLLIFQIHKLLHG